MGCFALCFVKRFAARHSAAQPLARCHHHRYLFHCHCPSPNSGVLKRFPGSPRFCPSIVGAFGRGSDSPLLLRPASELNRILSSSWSSAPRVSIGASSGRATGYGSSSLRSRSVRPGVGCQGRLDPRRNRAQNRSTDAPPLGSSRSRTESDLEFELVKRPARFDCGQLWASHGFRQLELKTQISSARSRMPRTI